MISISKMVETDFIRLSSSESVGSAAKIMQKTNVDYLLVEGGGEIIGTVTSHDLAGYPSSRLILDCEINRIGAIAEEALAGEALKVLEEKKVNFLVVSDREGRSVGVINREIIINSLFEELKKLNTEKDKYITELKRAEEQVRDLIRATLDAQEAERERICLEVHDGVTQTLASAFQYLQTLQTASLEATHARQVLLRASTLVKQAIQETREVINSLQPATLRDLGLVATLRQEIRQIEQENRWKIDFKADAIRLPQDVETGLYRIIHEAITNARKHAETKRLCVSITSADDQVRVEVRDWGVGFKYKSEDISRRRHTGLLSMRKRAELLQGTCNIKSTPGHGTVVSVEIPSGSHKDQHG